MKRLIKKSDALRLNQFGLDPNAIFKVIRDLDWQFHQDKIVTDINDEKSLWGAISDDGQYITEIYVYNTETDMKAASIICKIQDGYPDHRYIGHVFNINGASDAKRNVLSNGIDYNGQTIQFTNQYTDFSHVEEIPESTVV